MISLLKHQSRNCIILFAGIVILSFVKLVPSFMKGSSMQYYSMIIGSATILNGADSENVMNIDINIIPYILKEDFLAECKHEKAAMLKSLKDYCISDVGSNLNCTFSVEQVGNTDNGIVLINKMLQCIRSNILAHVWANESQSSTHLRSEGKYEVNSSQVQRILIDKVFWRNTSYENLFRDVIGLRLLISRPTRNVESPHECVPHNIPGFHKLTMSPANYEALNYNATLYRSVLPSCNEWSTDIEKSLKTKANKCYPCNFTSENCPHAAIYIIRNAVVTSEFGRVITSKYAYENSQCTMRWLMNENDTYTFNSYATRSKLRNLTEVFVTTQLFSVAVYHYMAEAGARMAPYLDFLRQNPQIKIHAPKTRTTKNVFSLYGLDYGRVVSESVWADVVYLPQGGGCCGMSSCVPCVQILFDILRRYQYQHTLRMRTTLERLKSTAECNSRREGNNTLISKSRRESENYTYNATQLATSSIESATSINATGIFLQFEKGGLASSTNRSKPNAFSLSANKNNSDADSKGNRIVLIKRTGKRALVNHCEVEFLLIKLAQEFRLEYISFPDNPVPDLNTTVEIFRGAAVVVAPHGAGLTNIIFSPSGTFVVEVLETKRVVLSYQTLSYQLGHRWHGLMSLTEASKLVADMVELQFAVRLFLQSRSLI